MCFGSHTVAAVEAFAAAHDLDLARSTFYSDSYNDLPLLEHVGTAVAVNPDVRLGRHARRRGWRIEQWGLISARRSAGARSWEPCDVRSASWPAS